MLYRDVRCCALSLTPVGLGRPLARGGRTALIGHRCDAQLRGKFSSFLLYEIQLASTSTISLDVGHRVEIPLSSFRPAVDCHADVGGAFMRETLGLACALPITVSPASGPTLLAAARNLGILRLFLPISRCGIDRVAFISATHIGRSSPSICSRSCPHKYAMDEKHRRGIPRLLQQHTPMLSSAISHPSALGAFTIQCSLVLPDRRFTRTLSTPSCNKTAKLRSATCYYSFTSSN